MEFILKGYHQEIKSNDFFHKKLNIGHYYLSLTPGLFMANKEMVGVLEAKVDLIKLLFHA